MNLVTIGSLSEYLSATDSASDGRQLFRGVRNATHRLIPSIGRYMPSHYNRNLTQRDLLALERSLFRRFMREAVGPLDRTPHDEWEWMALAQHHGVPTRCLDWSRNRLAALYFALEPAFNYGLPLADEDAAVFVWNSSDEQVPYEFGDARIPASPFEITNVTVFAPRHVHPRIGAQMAVLSVHPQPWEELDDSFITKICIASTARVSILKRLVTTMLDASVLFPDVDGLARMLRLRLLELPGWEAMGDR